MKNSLHAVYVLALFLFVGNFQAHAQERVNQNLRGFSAINASSGVDVYLSQGSTESVEVEAEEESLKYLITEVDNNNTLVIKMDDSLGDRLPLRMGRIEEEVEVAEINYEKD